MIPFVLLMHLFLAVAIVFICGKLFHLGGQGKKNARILGIPILLGLFYAIFLNRWIGLSLLFTYSTIRIGYGNWSPEDDPDPCWLARLTRDREGCLIRLLWALIVSAIGALPVVVYTHSYLSYLSYIILNCVVNFVLCKLKADVKTHETLAGISLGSVCLWL